MFPFPTVSLFRSLNGLLCVTGAIYYINRFVFSEVSVSLVLYFHPIVDKGGRGCYWRVEVHVPHTSEPKDGPSGGKVGKGLGLEFSIDLPFLGDLLYPWGYNQSFRFRTWENLSQTRGFNETL